MHKYANRYFNGLHFVYIKMFKTTCNQKHF